MGKYIRKELPLDELLQHWKAITLTVTRNLLHLASWTWLALPLHATSQQVCTRNYWSSCQNEKGFKIAYESTWHLQSLKQCRSEFEQFVMGEFWSICKFLVAKILQALSQDLQWTTTRAHTQQCRTLWCHLWWWLFCWLWHHCSNIHPTPS